MNRKKTNKIEDRKIEDFTPGIIYELIRRSYTSFTESFPDEKEKLYAQWEQENNDAFIHRETIGRCLAFTCVNRVPVGYYSWDDRHFPIGIIGQNCVLPEYRRLRIGSRQLETIIDLFREKNFSEIKVITGDHDFFVPAQNLYKKLGFTEHQRTTGKLFNLIELRKKLGQF